MKRAFLIAMALLCASMLRAQCNIPDPPQACAGGNGAATNGQNINAGETYWYSGSGTFNAGVSLNGGTLRICGDLTLNNISLGSGTIVVESGGSLTVAAGSDLFMSGNTTLVNRGSLIINRTLRMQNANNQIFNAAGAFFFMDGGTHTLEMNSATSFFCNQGTANIHTVFAQSGIAEGGIQLGLNSCLEVTDFNNNQSLSVAASDGQASLRFTGNAALNATLTNSNNLIVCQASGATTSGPGSFGNATVQPNCPSCSAALPVTLLDFSATEIDQSQVLLEWSTSSETNNHGFVIACSHDMAQWMQVAEVGGAGNSNHPQEYRFVDRPTVAGVWYYRLTQLDFDGAATTYPPISVNLEKAEEWQVYPNPAQTYLTIEAHFDTPVQVLDLTARDYSDLVVFTHTPNGAMRLDVSRLPSGNYLIRLGTNYARFIKS